MDQEDVGSGHLPSYGGNIGEMAGNEEAQFCLFLAQSSRQMTR